MRTLSALCATSTSTSAAVSSCVFGGGVKCKDAGCDVCHLYLHLSGGEFLCFCFGGKCKDAGCAVCRLYLHLSGGKCERMGG